MLWILLWSLKDLLSANVFVQKVQISVLLSACLPSWRLWAFFSWNICWQNLQVISNFSFLRLDFIGRAFFSLLKPFLEFEPSAKSDPLSLLWLSLCRLNLITIEYIFGHLSHLYSSLLLFAFNAAVVFLKGTSIMQQTGLHTVEKLGTWIVCRNVHFHYFSWCVSLSLSLYFMIWTVWSV